MKNQPTLFKTCNLYSRHRKVSIPASLVSNNIKLGFHVVVPQLQHPNSQARRLLGGHCYKNHDIPNSHFSKTCKCSDQNGSSRFINPDVTDSRNHKIAQMSQNQEITKLHIFQPCQCTKLTATSCHVNVSRLQRWLQQLQIHLAPNRSISAENIRRDGTQHKQKPHTFATHRGNFPPCHKNSEKWREGVTNIQSRREGALFLVERSQTTVLQMLLSSWPQLDR